MLQHREPEDEPIANDSGVTSGSDFVSSSPGSEHSDASHPAYRSPPSGNLQHGAPYYSTQVMRAPSEQIESQKRLCETPNSLSSPISESMASPNSGKTENLSHPNGEDALKRLQMSLEKNRFLPPVLSPKSSGGSMEEDVKSENSLDEYDEQRLRVPKVNSHGKLKTFKCKQCDFVAITKVDFWEHSRAHIKPDKLLTCTKCPFVTEYKHHLHYHLRNHFGSKPFQCNKCSYNCVNKSMLNSHMKSHSSIYQYRCADCSYASKYCHSLKLHLRKHKHTPAMVLNADGSPNPLPIVDVYGTRRGPKLKVQDSNPPAEETEPNKEPVLPFPLNQFLLGAAQQLQLPFPGFPFFGAFPGAIANPLLLQNLEKLALERQMPPGDHNESSMDQPEDAVLDLSKSGEECKPSTSQFVQRSDRSLEEIEGVDEGTTTMFDIVETVEEKPKIDETDVRMESNNSRENFDCQFCEICFGDPILYTMHMGYHGFKSPFACNMCGVECHDKVGFFLHIARTQHS